MNQVFHIEDSPWQVCTRCIYDARVPAIEFDAGGVCNYCRQVDRLVSDYGTGQPKGKARFEELTREIREAGKRKKYDCVIGVSGGTDSSYLVHVAREHGLRPLAVHYDNTWNSAIATMNIHKVLKALDVDLFTHVVANKEADDILRAFFMAGVAELDAATDLGFAFLLRLAAAANDVDYILEGHSFIAEGITPLGRNYFDGRYIQEIHRRFGRVKMETYPLMTFGKFLRSTIFGRAKFIRPLWYLDYSKEMARELLISRFGWSYYGGHHLENRITSFAHGVYLPQKFKADMRNNVLAARARVGATTREEAWLEYNRPPGDNTEIIAYFKKRLGLSDEQYLQVMREAPRNWTEYPTYKRRFELFRPLFYVLAKTERVPMSFYLKYCFPSKAPT